jgi:hypothetical protein
MMHHPKRTAKTVKMVELEVIQAAQSVKFKGRGIRNCGELVKDSGDR